MLSFSVELSLVYTYWFFKIYFHKLQYTTTIRWWVGKKLDHIGHNKDQLLRNVSAVVSLPQAQLIWDQMSSVCPCLSPFIASSSSLLDFLLPSMFEFSV